MPSMEIQPIVVGTAGHIDHGKSSLVRVLTGIDPDRLQEERERGLTIDLGFAHFLLPDGRRVGVVDVPGHERFVANMVAGATGIDLVLLVVAADDGVMPQTREHLAIMQLLGLERGLIVLTKIDLVDPELVELAVADVREACAGTFLAGAELYPVSNSTGAGWDALRAGLAAACLATPPRSAGGLFRMPIQRVFSAKGFGTVVTGIPVSGTAAPGDELEVLPRGQRVRVRGVQAYATGAERVRAGHSSALNVSDIDHGAVHRGDVLAAPGTFHGARWIAVRLRALPGLSRAVRDRTRVRFHTGTADPHGELVLLDTLELAPGHSALAQVRLSSEVVVAPGDRFVLRQLSPEVTLGGGVVLEESEHRLKRFKPFVLDGLAAAERALDSPLARLLDVLRRRGPRAASPEELAAELQQPRAAVEELLAAGLAERTVVALPAGRRYLEAGELENGLERLVRAAREYSAEHPLRLDLEARELRRRTELDKPVLEPLLELAEARGLAERRPAGAWRFHGCLPPTTAELEGELRSLAAELQRGALQPPSPEELAARLRLPLPALLQRLERLADEGRALRVGAELWFGREAYDRALAAVEENCRRHGHLEIPELRETLGTTRKWLIPLLEHFDGLGFTMRQGAHRVLRPR
jgi:selenocysteine-specific elongation factor